MSALHAHVDPSLCKIHDVLVGDHAYLGGNLGNFLISLMTTFQSPKTTTQLWLRMHLHEHVCFCFVSRAIRVAKSDSGLTRTGSGLGQAFHLHQKPSAMSSTALVWTKTISCIAQLELLEPSSVSISYREALLASCELRESKPQNLPRT